MLELRKDFLIIGTSKNFSFLRFYLILVCDDYLKTLDKKVCKLYNQVYDLHGFYRINNPDASIGVQCSMFRTVCSHKVVAVGFNTLRYDASVGVLNPPHE